MVKNVTENDKEYNEKDTTENDEEHAEEIDK